MFKLLSSNQTIKDICAKSGNVACLLSNNMVKVLDQDLNSVSMFDLTSISVLEGANIISVAVDATSVLITDSRSVVSRINIETQQILNTYFVGARSDLVDAKYFGENGFISGRNNSVVQVWDSRKLNETSFFDVSTKKSTFGCVSDTISYPLRCFDVNDNNLVSNAEGVFRLWDLRSVKKPTREFRNDETFSTEVQLTPTHIYSLNKIGILSCPTKEKIFRPTLPMRTQQGTLLAYSDDTFYLSHGSVISKY